jgi:drug/metabolite transporter (DMT)-like permease
MSISPEDAATALREITSAQTRSATLSSYARFAPFLILWGAVWFFGYGASALLPEDQGGLAWLPLVVLGSIGNYLLTRRQGSDRAGWRYGAFLGILALFIGAVFSIFGPVSPRQSGAFFPLLVALAYMLIGLWSGPRFVVSGFTLGALTLIGFFLLGRWFYAWMAVVGSGSLILMGLWLRRV